MEGNKVYFKKMVELEKENMLESDYIRLQKMIKTTDIIFSDFYLALMKMNIESAINNNRFHKIQELMKKIIEACDDDFQNGDVLLAITYIIANHCVPVLEDISVFDETKYELDNNL